MTGTYDGLVFTEGQSDEFTLMHDESRTITGLPAGLGYEVTETADAQFDTRSERATGTVAFSDTPIEAEFTNTRKVGSLTITKTVNGLNKLPGDDGVEFEFDVVLKHGEQGLSGTFGDYTFKNGVPVDEAGEKTPVKVSASTAVVLSGIPVGTAYTVTERAHGSFDNIDEEKGVTISGIPADVAYAVEEQGYTDFDKTCAGEAGTIDPAATAAPTALVTNTRQLGSLAVGKTVVSSNPEDKQGDKAKAFTFTVTLTGMTIDDGKYGDMTFEGNVATVTLKHGETATAAGLPAGIEYAVAEAPVKGFTNTVFDNESGVIPVKDTAEAKFTNTRDEGDLVVGKRVVSDLTADRDVAFTFTVELADETIHGPYGEMTFEDGVNVTNSLQLRNTLPLANDGADPTAPEGAAPVEPLGVGYEEDRNTGTPLPKFGGYTEAELEEQYSMFGYDTPKAGMLNTGDETPAWPWAFGGAGALALIALALLGRKKKRALPTAPQRIRGA